MSHFPFFDLAEDPFGKAERTLRAIDNLEINVVAINLNPKHSSPMDAELRHALDLRFPQSQEIGYFQVRWK